MEQLTKGERRRLSRYVCWLCEMPLHRDECGAIYRRCSPEDRAERRRLCLAHYRPRKSAEAA